MGGRIWVGDEMLQPFKRSPGDRGRVTGLAGFEGGLTIHARTLPMFAPMLDSGGHWVDSILQSKVSRAYLFTERSRVRPNMCDNKHGFAKYV
jgi:hypothetical protein